MNTAEVTLAEVLDFRDRRLSLQREMLSLHPGTLVSFTMNIAGPVKTSAVIYRLFEDGCEQLEQVLHTKHLNILCRRKENNVTGCLAFYSVDADAEVLKRLCIWLEETHPLGRLLDLDVFAPDGAHSSRESLGLAERPCIICGEPGRTCASRRLHSVEELQETTCELLYDYFLEVDAGEIMSLAAQSLRLEAWTTPKPGLVDLNNQGSHKDMDMELMMASISVLAPFFRRFFVLGASSAHESPEKAFLTMRKLGLLAEKAMFEATGGINTHKGAIFLIGTICGACGRLWSPVGLHAELDDIAVECSRLGKSVLERELNSLRADVPLSFGEQLYLKHGITGVRGEIINGLPSIRRISLPQLKKLTSAGKSLTDAGTVVLLYLIAGVCDTNMIRRGGLALQRQTAADTAMLLRLEPCPSPTVIRGLDKEFIEKNLSPGGCADLLAASYFFHFLAGYHL